MIINEKYLKQFSPIPLNYNMAEVKNYIPVAEKIWVIPLIGSDLFDEIDEQVKNNNLSEENSTLLTEGGLWQYLAFATVYECIPMIWSHISEVGVTKGKSDNSDSLDLKERCLKTSLRSGYVSTRIHSHLLMYALATVALAATRKLSLIIQIHRHRFILH